VVRLPKIEQLPLGSKKMEVEHALEQPGKVEPVSTGGSKMAWVYFDSESSLERATLVIDNSTDQLVAKTWEVESGDPEQAIDVALKRYPRAHFEKREPKWINPHAAPDEAYYVDSVLGLSIKFRKKRHEVSSITWTMPGTQAFEKREEPACVKGQKRNGLTTCEKK
jgi:hypothetical protein